MLCERETVDRSPPGEYRLAWWRRTLGSKVLFPRAASFQRITGRPNMDQLVIAQGDGHLSTKPETRVLLELCNEMVRTYKEIFGRGPTRARADWAGRDAVLCTLEDTLTRAERKMVEVGDHQRLQETRMFFQHACKDDFRESVERITGRGRGRSCRASTRTPTWRPRFSTSSDPPTRHHQAWASDPTMPTPKEC